MGLTRIKAGQISDIDYKQAVRAVTTSNVTLTGGAPAAVDGVSLLANDRVLVTGQNTASQNGLYRVQTLGAGSNGTWIRTTDANENGEIEAGMIVMVTEGTSYADTLWKLTTNNPIVIDTTALTFVLNSTGGGVAGSNTQVQFNDSGSAGASAAFTFNKTANILTVTGNIEGTNVTGTLTTAAQPNITSVGTLTSLSVTGNVSGGNLLLTGSVIDSGDLILTSSATNGNVTLTPTGTGTIVVNKNITNGQANGVGNIGSSTTYFNTVFAKATSAQYADLAELYQADQDYEPGTVVIFGGEYEITTTSISHDTRVAGVISTDPAFVMNTCSGGIPVALTGRVPCRVLGPVSKGDVLVTGSLPGVAQRLGSDYQPGCILGKSLDVIATATVETIEVVVGRF